MRKRRSAATVTVEGDASVRTVGELHRALLALLGEERAVRLDLSDAPPPDVAFIQLVASARRSFTGAGLGFEVDDALLVRGLPGVTSLPPLS